MARKRFQHGSLLLRGKRTKVWVGRWREDVVKEDKVVRVNRKEVLGTQQEYPTRRLAQRALEDRIAPINAPTYRPKNAITFMEFAERWKTTVLPQLKPSTQNSFHAHLKKHLVPCLGDTSLKDFTTETLQRLIFSLSECGLSPKTIRNVLATARVLWKSAKSWSYVTHNPFEDLVYPRRERKERRMFAVQEIKKILDTAQEPYKTFYWLAAETGLRAGELCGLMWEDFDLEKGILHVKRSAWRSALQTPKTNTAYRRIRLSLELTAWLRCRREIRDSELLFHTKNNLPWDNSNILHKFHKMLDDLKIPRGGFHAFRHANASWLLASGVDVKTVQGRLGHATASMTLDVYGHQLPEKEMQETMLALASLRPSCGQVVIGNA